MALAALAGACTDYVTETSIHLPATGVDVPERASYRVKRLLLGPPLVSAQLHEEKLSQARPRSACCPATASPPLPTAPRRC